MVGDHGLGLLGVVAAVHGPVVGELPRVAGGPRDGRGLERARGVVGGSEEVGRAGWLVVRDGAGHPCHGGTSEATREQLHQVGTGSTELGIEGRLEAAAHRGDRPAWSLLA